MRTIVLRGDAHCGKTTTLRMLYDELITQSTTLEPITEWGEPTNLDFCTMLLYNGCKVAIYSMGDLSRHTVAAVREYRAKGADILICSCRAYMVNPYKEMAKDGYTAIDKRVATTPEQYEPTNKADKALIIGAIK